ncbi:MAG: TIGR03905 family TSCPD domain-containing protein [Firmicutes bacterium]|nr:TIGR03905 family TSCPD domain-containing protein [Bacillota bacterium]
MQYVHYNKGTCSRAVRFEIEDGKVHNVSFEGGCNGNLKAISKLVEGQDAETVIAILKGNDCAGRGTSCADQFALGLEGALKKEAERV